MSDLVIKKRHRDVTRARSKARTGPAVHLYMPDLLIAHVTLLLFRKRFDGFHRAELHSMICAYTVLCSSNPMSAAAIAVDSKAVDVGPGTKKLTIKEGMSPPPSLFGCLLHCSALHHCTGITMYALSLQSSDNAYSLPHNSLQCCGLA